MNRFQGFPSRTAFTPIPNIVFSSLLADIDDMAELKTTLHVIAALYRKKGTPRFVGFRELLADAAVAASLGGSAAETTLRDALGRAVERGTLLHLVQETGSVAEDVYLLNDDAGRRTAEQVRNGERELAGLVLPETAAPAEEPTDIFTAYERNIGMLTPMIADELRDAEERYPREWILDAIKEAAVNNKRNIRYMSRILENWSTKGRSDGTHQRHPETADPDKYIRGKYGHIVRRR